MIDTSKKIRYQCPVTARRKTLEVIPHHGGCAGLLLIGVDGQYVESIILPEAAFLALWGAMSEYMVNRAWGEEEGES